MARMSRFAQMVEQSRHPNNNTKPIKRYFLRNKEGELARADSMPQRACLATGPQALHSLPAATLHGLTSAPGQLQPPTKSIPELFRTKRPSHGDLPRTSKKPCVRPTLSAALCSTPFVQDITARKHDVYTVSSQMVSVFDAPYQQPEELSQENVAAGGMMMKVDDMMLFDDTCDIMPCGMAPMPHSPTCDGEPVGCTTGVHLASAGNLTPEATNQLCGRGILPLSPSVHTPPECMAVISDQPPGAPRKRTKSATSSMSADSFDACDSVFAPGAPDWSPRTAVCRVLKFDDEMDE